MFHLHLGFITVDNTPPNQPIVSWPTQPIKNNIVYTNQTKFDITNSNQADIYQLKLKIGDTLFTQAKTNSNSFTATENREYQIGEIEVFFVDEAGNESIYTKNPQKIIIDTVAPPLLFDTNRSGNLIDNELTANSTRLYLQNISQSDQNKLNTEGITWEYSLDKGKNWTSIQLNMNGTNYIYLLTGILAIDDVHIKVSDIAGNTAVTKNSFTITVDIPKIISVTYSGGINKSTVQIIKDNVMLPMEIIGTIEKRCKYSVYNSQF